MSKEELVKKIQLEKALILKAKEELTNIEATRNQLMNAIQQRLGRISVFEEELKQIQEKEKQEKLKQIDSKK